MEYENVLLIGGPRDGKWITVLEGVPVQSGQGFKSAVFVFGNIDPMAALIAGYRRP